jgi:nicotinamidase-related amidase
MALSALDHSSALVVIDLQNGIVGIPTRPHAPSEVVARTVTLADAFRAAGRPVVLVRVSLRPDGSDAAPGGRRSRVAWVRRRPAGTRSSTRWPGTARTSW